jgi:hypothetical protein
MRLRLKSALLGAAAAALALSSAMPALAQEDTLVISIEGFGDWVLVTTRVCVNSPAGSICHTRQHWEWRPEEQREIHRCDGPCP